MLSGLAGCATANPGVMSSMPMVSGITQTRVHSREAEALEVRLIDKSPMAHANAQKSHKSHLQHQLQTAPYVTSDAKETLVTNYKFVIADSVIRL